MADERIKAGIGNNVDIKGDNVNYDNSTNSETHVVVESGGTYVASKDAATVQAEHDARWDTFDRIKNEAKEAVSAVKDKVSIGSAIQRAANNAVSTAEHVTEKLDMLMKPASKDDDCDLSK